MRVSKSCYTQQLAFVVNLAQLRITLEGSLSERLSTLGWPVDLSMGVVLGSPVYFGQQHSLDRVP